MASAARWTSGTRLPPMLVDRNSVTSSAACCSVGAGTQVLSCASHSSTRVQASAGRSGGSKIRGLVVIRRKASSVGQGSPMRAPRLMVSSSHRRAGRRYSDRGSWRRSAGWRLPGSPVVSCSRPVPLRQSLRPHCRSWRDLATGRPVPDGMLRGPAIAWVARSGPARRTGHG